MTVCRAACLVAAALIVPISQAVAQFGGMPGMPGAGMPGMPGGGGMDF